jgi:hypothetical protein
VFEHEFKNYWLEQQVTDGIFGRLLFLFDSLFSGSRIRREQMLRIQNSKRELVLFTSIALSDAQHRS